MFEQAAQPLLADDFPILQRLAVRIWPIPAQRQVPPPPVPPLRVVQDHNTRPTARLNVKSAIRGIRWLNRGGLRTGRGNRWTKERVASFRNKRDIPRYDPEQPPHTDWLTLMAAAKELGVTLG